MRFLVDTHVLIRWLLEPKRLTKEQTRVLSTAMKRGELIAMSDITLLEMALILGAGSSRLAASVEDLFAELRDAATFRVLPITHEIASEVAALGPALRDPADRAIVATARVHRLKLLTSDERIIASKLVAVVC